MEVGVGVAVRLLLLQRVPLLIPLSSRRVDCLAEWIRRGWMEMEEENEGFLCKREVELLLCVGCRSDGQK